jgi:hypothetical protein
MANFQGIIINCYDYMTCIESIISIIVFGPHSFSKFEAAVQKIGANRFIQVESNKIRTFFLAIIVYWN